MRKTQLGLALLASANLVLLSSPAFAEPPAADSAAPPPAAAAEAAPGAAEAAPGMAAPAPVVAEPAHPNKKKVTSGWIVAGIGGAATIAGIIVDAVGTGKGSTAGAGGVGDSGNSDNTRNDFYYVGTTLIVAGLATAFYGGTMVWSGNRGIETKSTAPSDDDAKNTTTKSVEAKLASSPMITIPLLGARF